MLSSKIGKRLSCAKLSSFIVNCPIGDIDGASSVGITVILNPLVYTVEPLKTDTFGEWPSVRLIEVPFFKVNLKHYSLPPLTRPPLTRQFANSTEIANPRRIPILFY